MLRVFLTFSILFLYSVFDWRMPYAQTKEPLRSEPTKDVRPPLKKCWDHFFENASDRFVAGSRDKFFVAESDGKLRALSAVTNETLWVSELGGRVESVLPSLQLGVFVLTNANDAGNGKAKANLRLLDAESGLTKYAVPIGPDVRHYLKVVGSRIISISQNGLVEALDAVSGTSVWKTKVSGSVTANPDVFDNTIAIATDAKKIEFISALDGTILSAVVTEREIKTLAFRENQMLVAGDDRGNVINFRDATGTIWWKFKSGARVGTIVETDDGILTGSFDNFVYMISKYSGDVKWKRRLDGRVIHRPIIAGKELIVTVSGEDDLVAIDIDKGKVLERTSLGDGRFPIAEPVLNDGGIMIFPVVGGLVAFSGNGCK